MQDNNDWVHVQVRRGTKQLLKELADWHNSKMSPTIEDLIITAHDEMLKIKAEAERQERAAKAEFGQ